MLQSDVQFSGLHVYGCRASCPVCGEPVDGGATACPLCSTPHHDDCWRYSGGCAMYACGVEQELQASGVDRLLSPFHWLLAPPNPDRAIPLEALFPFFVAMFVAVTVIICLGYSRLIEQIDQEVRAAHASEVRGRAATQPR